ncbi:MAG TPA: PIG-L family deacetylase [Ktedonosporobacter sp.]|nr:PIG-L family deacetylase [Ktedonosporobacter sp.]
MQLTSLKDITTRYRHIFLAPHFDDVVYACGGTLGVQVSSGLRPLIITIFGGAPAPGLQLSPFAQQQYRQSGVSLAQGVGSLVAARRKEDAAVNDYLECDYLWLDNLDAAYRGNPPYYTKEADVIGGEVHPADQEIDKHLAQDLLALRNRLPDAAWYAPLGVGRHVDHQLVCSAADRLVQSNARVYFYEDFPYVYKARGALDARLQELGGAFEPMLVEVSEFLPARLTAADMYVTQIGPNFGSQEAMHRAIEDYTRSIRPVETVRLERYWTQR